ncbi:MAG: hypothetical protein V3S60_01260 [Acidimicrobiia bacterium]
MPLTHSGREGSKNQDNMVNAAGRAARRAHLVDEATAATTGQAGLEQGDKAKAKLTQKDK